MCILWCVCVPVSVCGCLCVWVHVYFGAPGVCLSVYVSAFFKVIFFYLVWVCCGDYLMCKVAIEVVVELSFLAVMFRVVLVNLVELFFLYL
jgi:hypothetical protein